MARRPKGTQSVVINTIGDQLIKTGPGIIYSIHVDTDGITAGDRFAIMDGLNVEGSKKVECLMGGADNNFNVDVPSVGIECLTGIFFNGQFSGGAITITIGYD